MMKYKVQTHNLFCFPTMLIVLSVFSIFRLPAFSKTRTIENSCSCISKKKQKYFYKITFITIMWKKYIFKSDYLSFPLNKNSNNSPKKQVFSHCFFLFASKFYNAKCNPFIYLIHSYLKIKLIKDILSDQACVVSDNYRSDNIQ